MKDESNPSSRAAPRASLQTRLKPGSGVAKPSFEGSKNPPPSLRASRLVPSPPSVVRRPSSVVLRPCPAPRARAYRFCRIFARAACAAASWCWASCRADWLSTPAEYLVCARFRSAVA